MNTGSYVFCKNGDLSLMQIGNYTRAGMFVFLQEEVPNFYA